MQEAQNTTLVQNIYAAFGRGDIQTLLGAHGRADRLAACDWRAASVPTAGDRRGKAAVGDFFRTLAETLTFEDFQTNEFVAQGDKVVVIGRYHGHREGHRTAVSQ
jgi:ketosteroid isomerase-like protein